MIAPAMAERFGCYQVRARNIVHAVRLGTALMVKLQIILDCDRDEIAALRRIVSQIRPQGRWAYSLDAAY